MPSDRRAAAAGGNFALTRSGRRQIAGSALALALAAPPAAMAAGPWQVAASMNVSEIYTDNVVAGAAESASDYVTQISPAVAITARGGRLSGNFNYRFSQFLYSRDSERNRHENNLSAAGTLEVLDDWLFVDFAGVIAQQTISAFGAQSSSDANVNDNRTETSNYRVSPRLQGPLGSFARYEVRYNRSLSHSKSDQVGDNDSEDLTAILRGATALPKLGWQITAMTSTNEFEGSSSSADDRLSFQLNYRFDNELQFAFVGGSERENLRGGESETSSTTGLRVDWNPNPRTTVNFSQDNRPFGDTHSFQFNYRTPLSAWRYADSRDVTYLPVNLTATGEGSMYDLLYSQLASAVPDPVARDQQVRETLRLNGIAANPVVTTGFLAARASVDRRRELSLVLNGARNTVTYTYINSNREAFDGGSTATADDFSGNSSVRQRGFKSNWSHRLTPQSTIGMASSWLNTSGTGDSTPTTRQNISTMNYSTQLGAKTSLALSGTRSRFRGDSEPRDETSVVGTLAMRF